MEHTKGELRKDGYGIYVDEKDEVNVYLAKICGMPVGCGSHEANAARLVKCWNCHDELRDTLKMLWTVWESDYDPQLTDGQIEQIEQALAKAKQS